MPQLQVTENALGPIFSVWHECQIRLPEVKRFEKYVKLNPELRTQNTLQHSYSLTVLAAIFLEKLRPFLRLDEALLLKAVAVHDFGEGELLRDVLFIDKSSEKDLDEYKAFMHRFSGLGEGVSLVMEQAFLLQFARKNPECFPPHAREVMDGLWKAYSKEVLAFEALETWDYLFYPIECFMERGDRTILTQVLRNQVPRLDEYAERLPGFGKTIWVPELRFWCIQFLLENPEVPLETKAK